MFEFLHLLLTLLGGRPHRVVRVAEVHRRVAGQAGRGRRPSTRWRGLRISPNVSFVGSCKSSLFNAAQDFERFAIFCGRLSVRCVTDAALSGKGNQRPGRCVESVTKVPSLKNHHKKCVKLSVLVAFMDIHMCARRILVSLTGTRSSSKVPLLGFPTVPTLARR